MRYSTRTHLRHPVLRATISVKKIRPKYDHNHQNRYQQTHKRCGCRDIFCDLHGFKATRALILLQVIVDGVREPLESCIQEFSNEEETTAQEERHPFGGAERNTPPEEENEEIRNEEELNIPLTPYCMYHAVKSMTCAAKSCLYHAP